MNARPGHFQPIILLSLLLFAGASGELHAQQESLVSYNEQFGLNRNMINDIVRDSSGNYWIATERDIIRFDGANFIEIKPSSGSFHGGHVIRLHDQGNSLLLVYEKANPQRFDLKDYTLKDIGTLPAEDALAVGEDTVYILQRDGWLIREVGGVVKQKRKFQLDGNKAVMRIWQGKLLLIMQDSRALILDPRDISTSKERELPVTVNTVELYFTEHDQNLYYFAAHQAHRIGPDFSVERLQDPVSGSPLNTDYMSFVHSDRYFYIEHNKRLFEFYNGHKQLVPLPGIGNAELRIVMVQDSSHVLVGTNQGLFQLREKSTLVTKVEEPDRVRETDIRIRRRILPWKDGKWVMLGYPHTYLRDGAGMFSELVPNVASSYDGLLDGDHLYMCTEGGGFVHVDLNNPKYDIVEPGPFLRGLRFGGIQQDKGSDSIFVGVRDSLLVYDKSRGTGATVWKRLGTGMVRCILHDPDDRTWWVGTETGLFRLGVHFNLLDMFQSAPGRLTGTVVSDLLIEKNSGRLWVAHDNGVDILDRRKGHVVDHLPNNLFSNPRVTTLMQDDSSRIWISTYSGLLGFDPASRAYVKLGRENGLTNTEFNYSSSAKLDDGRMIFGGLNGYDILRTTEFDFTMMRSEGQFTTYALFSPTDTIFRSFENGDRESVEFNVDRERLRLYLSARNRADASFYRYEYNLDGENWIPVKGSPFIDLLNLEPDEYNLQVRAYNEFGTLITFPPLKVLASEPFFKSKAFIRILLVVVGLLVGLYIFMLLNQRKREQDLKEKIAMDLHDEVGTILTRTLYMTRTSSIQGEKGRLEQFLNEALYSLRAYIHTMNRSQFTLGQLQDEVKDMLSTTMRSAGYEADMQFKANRNTVINPELYRDIKLSMYEIMNNTIRHAGGDRFSLKLREEPGILYISTCDNGQLSDTAQIQEKGNGVRNLVKRVRRHRGEARFAICSEGHGLQINMSMSFGS